MRKTICLTPWLYPRAPFKPESPLKRSWVSRGPGAAQPPGTSAIPRSEGRHSSQEEKGLRRGDIDWQAVDIVEQLPGLGGERGGGGKRRVRERVE